MSYRFIFNQELISIGYILVQKTDSIQCISYIFVIVEICLELIKCALRVYQSCVNHFNSNTLHMCTYCNIKNYFTKSRTYIDEYRLIWNPYWFHRAIQFLYWPISCFTICFIWISSLFVKLIIICNLWAWSSESQ